MKLAILSALGLLAIGEVDAKASAMCLYCKRMDSFNSFLYSYSYCKTSDKCLERQWNYVNQYCTSKWIEGWMLDIDEDCEADQAIGVCKTFSSYDNVEKKSYPTATL